MAVQFDSTGDLLYRLQSSGSIPTSTPLSACFHLRVDADSGQANPAWVRYADAGGTLRQMLQVNSSGATNLVQVEAQASGGNSTGVVFTLSAWRAVGIKVHDNGDGTLETSLYVDGAFVESQSSAKPTDTSTAIAWGGTGADTPKMSIAGGRVWQAELSSGEFLAEAASLTPVRTSNLWAQYNFASGALTTDSSGNSRTLTSNGSPTFVADPSLGSGITLSFAKTEANDTLSAAATNALALALAKTEANDTLSAAATNALALASATTDANDTLSSAATTAIALAGAATEAADTVSAAVATAIAAAAAITEAPDTVAATVTSGILSAAITEAGDTVVSTATVGVALSLAATEAADTVASTVTASLSATASITEANDTLSANIGLPVVALDAAITEASDTVSSTATNAIALSSTKTEANDTAVSVVTNAIALSESVTEANDTLTSELLGPGTIVLSAQITELPDLVAATLTASVALAATIQEAGDTSTSTVEAQVTLSADIHELGDTVTALVMLVVILNANIAEIPDTLIATLRQLGPDQPVPFVLRGDVNAQIVFDLGLLAICADGTVVLNF